MATVGGLHNQGNQAVNTDLMGGAASGAASGPGGLLSQQKDARGASTDPNFGEIMKQFQSKYGAKPEKAREIKKTLGKDDFLRIMITQMKNQDPSKPFNADEMAAQMAQYTSVEQLQNVNQNLQKLDSNNKTVERMQMTSMIGKVVTVDRERFPHIENQNESLTYALPKNSAETKLTILSETGETVLEKDLGPQKSGEQSFEWDGKKSNTLPAKNGNYVFKITAKDASGFNLNTNPKSQARIVGVTFEGSEPIFLIGDAKNQQKVSMKNIIKIEEAPQQVMPWGNPLSMQGIAGAQGAPGAPGAANRAIQPATTPAGSAFFTFQKGKGSENIDPGSLPSEAQAALARYAAAAGPQQGGAQPQSVSQPQAVAQAQGAPGPETVANAAGAQEKGFPSGLTDSGQTNYTLPKGGDNK